jgi:hypothetical protein
MTHLGHSETFDLSLLSARERTLIKQCSDRSRSLSMGSRSTKLAAQALVKVGLPPPAQPPASAKGATAADEPHYEKQYHRPDGSVDDRRDYAGAKVDTELRHQPLTNECSYNSDYEIADNSEPGTLDDLSRQPPRNEADQ